MILTILVLVAAAFFLYGSIQDANSSKSFKIGSGIVEREKIFGVFPNYLRAKDGSFRAGLYFALTGIAIAAGTIPSIALNSVEGKAAAMVAFGVLGGRRVWAAKKNRSLIAVQAALRRIQ